MKQFVLFFSLIAVFAILAIGIQQKKGRLVPKITVDIQPLAENKFLITKKGVYQKIESFSGFDIDRAALKDFNPPSIEHMLNKDKRVKNAEVFFDKHGALNVSIVQRQPIVKVETTGVQDFYLDKEGAMIPAKNIAVVRVPIATGNIEAYKTGYLNELNHSLKDVFEVASKVYEDEFLNPLVEQIHFNEKDEIILIPKLGRNKIILGSTVALDTKLDKLKLYYKKGVKRVGLDRFSEINLSYENQIVGVK